MNRSPELNEPVLPLFYFWDDIVEIHPSYEDFDNGLEFIDVENGEYDSVFDSVGGQWRFVVVDDRGPRPQGRWATLRWRLSGLSLWSLPGVEAMYDGPTDVSREAFASELRRVLGIPAEHRDGLPGLVELAQATKSATHQRRTTLADD